MLDGEQFRDLVVVPVGGGGLVGLPVVVAVPGNLLRVVSPSLYGQGADGAVVPGVNAVGVCAGIQVRDRGVLEGDAGLPAGIESDGSILSRLAVDPERNLSGPGALARVRHRRLDGESIARLARQRHGRKVGDLEKRCLRPGVGGCPPGIAVGRGVGVRRPVQTSRGRGPERGPDPLEKPTADARGRLRVVLLFGGSHGSPWGPVSNKDCDGSPPPRVRAREAVPRAAAVTRPHRGIRLSRGTPTVPIPSPPKATRCGKPTVIYMFGVIERMLMPFDDRGDDGSSGRATSHRRQFLKGIGTAGLAGMVAGCLGGDDDTPTPTTESGNGNGNGNGDDTTPTESPAFTIRSVDPSETSARRPNLIEITATIENGGSASAEETVELSADGTVLASTDLSLDAGQIEGVPLEVNTEDLDPGEYEFTVTTAEDDASGTLTVEPFLDPPRNLLSFEAEQPLQLSVGTNTITAVLNNPYLSPVEDVEATLVVPDGWESDPGTVSVDSVDPAVPASVEWEVSVPESAAGEQQLTVELSYSSLGETAELSTDLSVTVSLPLSVPFGMDCGGAHTDEVVEIDGLAYQPAADVAQTARRCTKDGS
ncbi:hypothetical protein BRD03_09340 [Halobacteriales archaeon QS_9_68_17]|nr:MAG: hypothetical protein BRD03_09340 [Halobacteriales archaeon QS_9_68_17]